MASNFDIFVLTKDFADDEARLNLLLNMMKGIYENTKEEVRNKNTKTFVTKFLEHYSCEESKYRSDPRLLEAWNLLAKTSTTLGYEAVMKKLDSLGYFKYCPEFYRLWGQHCVEKKDRRTFDELFFRVGQLFKDNLEIASIFDEYLRKFGPRIAPREDLDGTAFFFEKLGTSPLARGDFSLCRPRASLSVVSEETEGNISGNISAVSSGSDASAASYSLNASSPKPQEVNQSSADNSSPGFSFYLSDRSASSIEDSTPTPPAAHKESFPTEMPASPVLVSMKMLSDDKENEPMAQTPAAPSSSHQDVTLGSPLLLTARKRRDSDEDPVDDNPFGDIAMPKAPVKSLFQELEDVSSGGLNKESATRAKLPKDGSPDAVKEEEDQPFTFAPRSFSKSQ